MLYGPSRPLKGPRAPRLRTYTFVAENLNLRDHFPSRAKVKRAYIVRDDNIIRQEY
jgi:hypothetical protein